MAAVWLPEWLLLAQKVKVKTSLATMIWEPVVLDVVAHLQAWLAVPSAQAADVAPAGEVLLRVPLVEGQVPLCK